MATSYTLIKRNGTITGIEVQQGWKTVVPERADPWSYRLTNSGPWYYQVPYEYNGEIYTMNLRSVAQMYDSSVFDAALDPTGTLQRVLFRAFEKFKDKCADSASLGATLAEGGAAFSMIAARAGQIARAAKALKRLRFGDFARELALTESGSAIKRKWQKLGHNLGSVWLEYSYGWKPLLQDLHDAADVLQNPFYKGNPVVGNSSDTQTVSVNYNQGGQRTVGSIVQTIRAQYGATVNVDNPNLDMLNRAGLVNPLSVLWEIVPFSFVIDWFTPVGNFLENFTFGMGLDLSRKWMTYKVVTQAEAQSINTDVVMSPKRDTSSTCEVRRTVGWNPPPLPDFRFPKFPRDRALNALSLAVTALSSLQSGVDRNLVRR